MGWRVRLKRGREILFSKSYPTKKKAVNASHRKRGAKGVVKS